MAGLPSSTDFVCLLARWERPLANMSFSYRTSVHNVRAKNWSALFPECLGENESSSVCQLNFNLRIVTSWIFSCLYSLDGHRGLQITDFRLSSSSSVLSCLVFPGSKIPVLQNFPGSLTSSDLKLLLL